MFRVGDKVVHPMHGAGVIDGIVREKICGTVQEYYVFKMPVGGLVLKIPIATSQAIGLRDVVDAQAAEKLLAAFPTLDAEMTSNWNHRYRENMQRLKSGDLYEVARVVKSLMYRERQRGLSTGERKMLHNAKQILMSEIVLSAETDYGNTEAWVDRAMMQVPSP